MTEFGKTLREAREAKGLTVAQIAEQTHLLPQIVGDLENEDFHRISAPIYGRGFVKLYCETVGLESKPLVDEFMAILNGEREPAIRLKKVELPAEEEEGKVEGEGEGEGEQRNTPPPVYTQPELGEAVEAKASDEGEQGVPHPSVLAQPRQYHPDYARAAAPTALPFNLGRMILLVLGAIAVILALVFGIRALYRASMGLSDESAETKAVDAAPSPRQKETKAVDAAPSPRQKEAKAVDAAPSPRQKEAKGKDQKRGAGGGSKKTADTKSTVRPPRTPKAVPPLYID